MNRRIVILCFFFFLAFGLVSASAQGEVGQLSVHIQDTLHAPPPPPEDGPLSVNILPKPSQLDVCTPDDKGNKAQWRVDGGNNWYDCNAGPVTLSGGSHKVEFKDVSGWITPPVITVNIKGPFTTVIYSYYTSLDYYYDYSDIANTYFGASGFDHNGDGQPDPLDLYTNGLFASYITDEKNACIQGSLGGMTAPWAYYPDVCGILTQEGNDILIADGTYERPESGSALEFRSILYATDGINALKAFYTKAIQAFTPQLLRILEAEERFREALRVNPYYEDALNGLLETYYARAEGFTLIGNDYIARAYKHKFDRKPNEQKSITELEIEDISSALICYETGFREFMKLFNPEFIGLGQERNPYLDINAEWLFLSRRFPNPNNPYEDKVSYESLRGQTSAIGVSSHAFDGNNKPVGPIQGSPNIELEVTPDISLMAPESKVTVEMKRSLAQKALSANQDEWNTVDAPVKFQLPIIEGAPLFKTGTSFSLRFGVDIVPESPIQGLEMVIEFDYTKLDILEVDFTGSAFPNNQSFIMPNDSHGGMKLFANQLLVKAESGSPVSGTGRKFVTVTFFIKSDAAGDFSVYAAGSGMQNFRVLRT